ncbi:hypothetical protein QJQ45_009037 [Haematococcus lacustris]|nr:hypothetical protein QJQ45_009037 [Haematococcus lacustris]
MGQCLARVQDTLEEEQAQEGVDAGSARGPATNRIVPSGVGHRGTAQERAVQRRSRTASLGQAAVVLIARTSGHRGVCVRCCSHHLEIADSSAHDSLCRSQPQFARLMEALMEWNPAVAPLLDKCASQLGTATKAARPCSRKGSEEQQRASLGTAAAVHVGEVMLVHLPPHAAAAFPAWANCLYALSLHMTSWQPPAEDAASVPAILLQLTPLATLGAAGAGAGAGAGQQVLDSVRSVQEAVACLGPPALPTGPLVAGLSGRLLRLVSTLDALPSLVTLCTVEGQILYQNSSSLFYTGSPAARTAAAESRHRPGSVKSSGSFLADLLQLQPELVEEVLETVVVGSDVWSQVVRVPELLAVEVPSNPRGARRASVCPTRSATVLSAAAEASMAHAMGMLMVTPALAAATASFSASQQIKARLQQQGATPLTQLQAQHSGMNKHPSLPSAPAAAAAQPITPSPTPAVTLLPVTCSWLTQSLGVARGSHQLTKPSCSSPAIPITISHSAIRASTQELSEARRTRTSLDLGVVPGSPQPSAGQALPIHPTTTSQTGSRLGRYASLNAGMMSQWATSSDSHNGRRSPSSFLLAPRPRQRLLTLLSLVDQLATGNEGRDKAASSGVESSNGLWHHTAPLSLPWVEHQLPSMTPDMRSHSHIVVASSQDVVDVLPMPEGTGDEPIACSRPTPTGEEGGEEEKWSGPGRRVRLGAAAQESREADEKAATQEQGDGDQLAVPDFPSSLHEVTVTALVDPETNQQVLMVMQTDVSVRSVIEERLMALTAAQMTLLEAMFPRFKVAFHSAVTIYDERHIERWKQALASRWQKL